MRHELSLNNTVLTVDDHGAEAVSLRKKGVEYIWSGDPAYWGRHAPVLFPFVGQVRGGKYRFGGREYSMGQHGFARDSEFTLTGESENSMTFLLASNEETLKKYPFAFDLYITYTLGVSPENEHDTVITVTWKVVNKENGPMYFSIGGHPAFMCPIAGMGDWKDYKIFFARGGKPLESITYRPITDGGNVGNATKTASLTEGMLTPTDELFAGDALILEGEQADHAGLVDPNGVEYLKVDFSTPLVGIWSPVGKHAPFICIEPWYGRTDSTDFTGTLEERAYTNTLARGGVFEKNFSVTV